MSPRMKFPRLNRRFDVKHIRDDLHISGVSDPEVFRTAVKLKRLIVTFNGNDFRQLVLKSKDTGVIDISGNLKDEQIDVKLTSLLIKSTTKDLYGKFRPLSGETE